MISENTKAILLLTTYFNNSEMSRCKPLTVNGYGYLARWLNTYGYQPSDLLQQDKLNVFFDQWQDVIQHEQVKQKTSLKRIEQTIAGITPERLQTLLERGASLSLALEKWTAAGIWILDRSHSHYPTQIKHALKEQAPAILFGVGNVALLAKPSVGFVGARSVEQEDLTATDSYVQMINELGYQVVSGGAKGIDSHAMLASLNKGNTSVGVMADNLYTASVNAQWRPHLKNETLALITPFYPEARFTPANAMQRNKYIYLLSHATVVVCSAESIKGKQSGTWEGAKENLKNNWVPLLVSAHKQPNHVGNTALLNGLDNITTTAKKISPSDSLKSVQALITNKPSELPASKAPAESLPSVQAGLFGTAVEEVGEFPVRSNEAKPTINVEERDKEQLLEMPLLEIFYKQLTALFEQQNELTKSNTVSAAVIESQFPEFSIMGKQALAKWLAYLVEGGLLLRPNVRKNEFCMPSGRSAKNDSKLT